MSTTQSLFSKLGKGLIAVVNVTADAIMKSEIPMPPPDAIMDSKQNTQLSVRLRAIWCCIWFGLIPWPVYEKKCHYSDSGMTYVQHLMLNVGLARVWITKKELRSDWEFEKKTNPSWHSVICNMFCLSR